MTIQGFFDESTDGTTFVIGGFIATVQQWAAFTADWEELADRLHANSKGQRSFKASRQMRRPPKRVKFAEFTRIIDKHLLLSVTLVFQVEHLKTARDWVWPEADTPADLLPLLRQLQKPYHFAVHQLLAIIEMNRETFRDIVPVDEPIYLYFDDTTEKKGVVEGYDAYRASLPEGHPMKRNTLRFEDDNLFVPLQAADLRVWQVREACTRSVEAGGAEMTVDARALGGDVDDRRRDLHVEAKLGVCMHWFLAPKLHRPFVESGHPGSFAAFYERFLIGMQ